MAPTSRHARWASAEQGTGLDLSLAAACLVLCLIWVAAGTAAGANAGLVLVGAAVLAAGGCVLFRIAAIGDEVPAAAPTRPGQLHAGDLDLLLDNSPEMLWVHDAVTLRFLAVNPVAAERLGWSPDDLSERTVIDLQAPDHRERVRSTLRTLPEGPAFAGEWCQLSRDGQAVWTEVMVHPAVYDGRPAHLVVAHDTTERRRTEAALKEREAHARAILDHAADAIVTVDGRGGTIESLNPAAERMFGWSTDEVAGRGVDALLEDGRAALTRTTSNGGIVTLDPPRLAVGSGVEIVGRRRDGTRFPVELSVTEIDLGDRTIVTGIARDVTERKVFESQLAHQATHDPLTGLPNRVLFMDRLEQALARLSRHPSTVAVLFCDLDHFKVVNDSLGHSEGDHLLAAVAERLQSVVRPGDTVARFGGDEFVVLCENLEHGDDSVEIAGRLANVLRSPVVLEGGELVVSASIGIACTSECVESPEDLLRDADAAMYRAKEQGRDRHAVFDTRLRSQAVSRLETERALRQALLRGELVVHYQPEVSLTTGHIRSVEALVRWNAPGLGLVGPDHFLQVAEETGLIVPVGAFVLEAASAEAARWRTEIGDDAPVLWVNVSARQLVDPALLAAVAEAVSRLPSPAAIGLEITETALVPDDARVTRAMEQLAELGVSIALDDFGTGFASLAYLWRFPADVLKIDQTFVAALGHERSATVIVASVVQLAQTLGKTTVGEGVETVAQLSQLRRLGCDAAQGHLLSRPIPADAMAALLRHPPDFLDVTTDRPDPSAFGWK